jgi:hypothetical protein
MGIGGLQRRPAARLPHPPAKSELLINDLLLEADGARQTVRASFGWLIPPMILLLAHRLLCCFRGHAWMTVAAGHPAQQCIYCERVRYPARSAAWAPLMRGRIAIPSAKSLKRSRPKPKPRELPDVPVILEGVRSPRAIEREKRRAR